MCFFCKIIFYGKGYDIIFVVIVFRLVYNDLMEINHSSWNEKESLWESDFHQIYKSEAWRNLDPLDRAQLLMVAEWMKPWTIIEWNQTGFFKILSQLRLEYSYNTDERLLFPVYVVCKSEVLWEYFQKLLQWEHPWYWDAYHYINGNLLGYPECCTNEYCNPSINIVKRRLFSPNRFISNFTYESIENWWYPDEFNYCPPSFTPCSIHCNRARKILESWKMLLIKYDPEAAGVLSEFNIRNNSHEIESFHGQPIPWKVKSILLDWD